MMSENIKIYKKTEEGYPKTLLQLPDAPSRLYVLGELPAPMRPAIAIVGARNCSSYGKNMANEYASLFLSSGDSFCYSCYANVNLRYFVPRTKIYLPCLWQIKNLLECPHRSLSTFTENSIC